ncbi:hypothetical protein PENTCL1PPCAC_20782, partial [Pristionchus entomophagus]
RRAWWSGMSTSSPRNARLGAVLSTSDALMHHSEPLKKHSARCLRSHSLRPRGFPPSSHLIPHSSMVLSLCYPGARQDEK